MEKYLPLPGIEPRTIAIPTGLSWLSEGCGNRILVYYIGHFAGETEERREEHQDSQFPG
jgi:hypothetical protein